MKIYLTKKQMSQELWDSDKGERAKTHEGKHFDTAQVMDPEVAKHIARQLGGCKGCGEGNSR